MQVYNHIEKPKSSLKRALFIILACAIVIAAIVIATYKPNPEFNPVNEGKAGEIR